MGVGLTAQLNAMAARMERQIGFLEKEESAPDWARRVKARAAAELRMEAQALRTASAALCGGLPGEIVAGVVETAQRAQDLNGELLSIAVRVSDAGNVEIVSDPVTIAMDRLDALRLAAILRREADRPHPREGKET